MDPIPGLFLFACLLAAPVAALPTFNVSPGGSDRNPGTPARPFATLQRARDAVRALPASARSRGVTVEVAGGTYEIPEPLGFGTQDSGTATGPVVWRARKGESVRILGGRFVKGWETVKDPAILARLDPAARGKVMVADLRSQGITRYGEMKSAPGWGASEAGLELFYNDRPMTLARWPNEGTTTVKGVQTLDFDVRGTRGTVQPRFLYEGDRPARWAAEPDPMVHGWWFWDWADQRFRVKSINPSAGLIELDAPRVEIRKGQWYYAYNLLCELDRPGEWYLDRQAGRLYFWPPTPIQSGRAMVSLVPGILALRDASFITFRGFTLEGCQGTAVTMSGGEGNRVVACTIRNTGSFAVQVEGGRNHGVVGCDLYQMGDGGISLHGGDRRTLTHAGHFAENNHIHHFSRWNPMYKVGVELVGVGSRAAHNLIHSAPHVAIGFNGQEHLIEYNEIHNVVEHANDAGAIYTQPGGDETWTMRGNVIRYNYVHHIYGYRGGGCVGVYLDDCFSSIHCYGNLFRQVPSAMFVGGGRDSIFENNILVDCNPSVHVDARGLGWANTIEPMLRQDLESVPYRQPPWSTRYPQLLTLLEDDPMAPKGNLFARNICVGGRWDDIEGIARPMVRFESNVVGQDPGFVDPVRHDYRLKPGAAILAQGFKQLPFSEMGLVKSPDRASWPVVHPVTEAKPVGAGSAVLRYPKPVAVPPVTAEGTLETAGAVLALAETNTRIPLEGKPVTARAGHDAANLYISLEVPMQPGAAPVEEGRWGSVDGVEVCFRDTARGSQPATTWVMQGFPNGSVRGSGDAGAMPEAAARLARATHFTADRTANGWHCRWRIPLAAADIRLRPGLRLGFNIGVRRTAPEEWVCWAGTNGPNWQLDSAGVIVLK